MSEPLDELYLTWLYRQIADPDIANPTRTYWNLARQLYHKEFIWFIPNDDNRVEDGKYLRYEFTEELGLVDVDPAWMNVGCSMLELLVGLSRRLSFYGEGEPRVWFWHMIDNLDIEGYNDRGSYPTEQIEEALDCIIWRTYNRNGTGGGLFPLRRAKRDQREVELWYQLHEYLVERV